MAFLNEYVPPLEQETSEFFRKARETLRTGHSKYDAWTVDRERDMVLFRSGGGHSLDSADEDYWSFIDRKGEYSITTWLRSKSEVSSEEIAISRQIGFRSGEGLGDLDAETIACIKDALKEEGKSLLFNLEYYKRAQLKLIDSNGKEI